MKITSLPMSLIIKPVPTVYIAWVSVYHASKTSCSIPIPLTYKDWSVRPNLRTFSISNLPLFKGIFNPSSIINDASW
jgi:hypothetical protein